MTREVYVMRIWQNSSDLESCPVTLTDTQGGQTCGFADLDKFVLLLKEKLEEPRTSLIRKRRRHDVWKQSFLRNVSSSTEP
jgi:hypothetical protein